MDLSIGKSRWLRISTLVAGIAVLVSACGTSTSTSDQPKNGGTLTFRLDADAQSMNPFEGASSDVSTARAIEWMWPNLYDADKNLNIVPGLADGMPTVSSDSLTYTVKLKKNAKWSDGSPITADDVVMTVKMQADPNLDTDSSFDWGELKSVEKVDQYTVKFVTNDPFAPFLANNLATFVAPASVYGKLDPAKMRKDPTNQNPGITGGPYTFVKWVPGSEIDLQANPNFYGGKPHIDKIVERIITNETAGAQALLNGDVGYSPEITSAARSSLKNQSAVKLYEYPDLAYYDVRMNLRAGHPFADKNVRLAFAYALDKDSIVKAATDGAGTTMWGDVPPASWAYDDTAVVKFTQDVSKAKGLMQTAGYTIGSNGIATKGGKPFTYDFCYRADKPQRQKAVEIMSDQLKAIGMNLKPKGIDFKVYYKGKAKGGCGLQTGEFDLGFAGWGLALDPDDYQIFSKAWIRPENNPSGENYTGFSSPELDALLNQERTTVKPTVDATKAARKTIFNQIQKILGGDVITYFMWADNSAQGFSSNVAGVVAGGKGTDMNYIDQFRNTQAFATWWLKNAK
jgi:peptide/nickel transport system substrate-binding protein